MQCITTCRMICATLLITPADGLSCTAVRPLHRVSVLLRRIMSPHACKERVEAAQVESQRRRGEAVGVLDGWRYEVLLQEAVDAHDRL